MNLSIRFKFPMGFFLIFTVTFLLLTFSVSNILEKSNEDTITREMKAIKNNSSVYVRQSLMTNDLNNDEASFSKIARDITEELRLVTESEVSAYNVKGQFLYGTVRKPSQYEDLSNAAKGITSYNVRTVKNKTMVYFSYPVVIVNNKVGILCFGKDYSFLYLQSRHISEVIFYTALAVFIAAFAFSYLLSRNISKPLLRLNHEANRVAGGSLDVSLESGRRDEIGDLVRNFNIMVEKISAQIITIRKDRDNLAEINNYRKHFFDNVTHELKTPLTTILGYAEIIRENSFSDMEFFNTGINHIINESKRLHNMVLKLLEISKDSSSVEDEFTQTDIGCLLKSTCSGMELKAQRYGNTLVCDIKESMHVYGSGDKLRQVFINLIDNAIKYGYPDLPINVSVTANGGFAEIVVSNSGDGIEEEYLSNIFTPFFRVDKIKSREIGSCGLGLSISKTIVENHKGTIDIASEPYRKTRVTVRLPLC